MNPGPDSTPTPTNCLRQMQWNANGVSGEIIELLNILHSINANIAAIHEAKLTDKTIPVKMPGWAVVRHERSKNKGGNLPILIKDTILFIDNTAALSQSADPHLKQQGISITMPKRQQPHIHIYIPPRNSCSAGHSASITHMVSSVYCWGFSRKKPSRRKVHVALDLSAAFHNVDHQQLPDSVHNTNIPATIRRWLNNYMQNRRA